MTWNRVTERGQVGSRGVRSEEKSETRSCGGPLGGQKGTSQVCGQKQNYLNETENPPVREVMEEC